MKWKKKQDKSRIKSAHKE